MWIFTIIKNMIKRTGSGKRAFVGVSGGVDSSVTALLLKLYGYDVMGVFIRTWQPDWTPCTWRDERRDAMRVCAYLDIPFHELNLEQEYKMGVADYMISEYRAGRTPNPDVMCNREVKFGGFLSWALDQGADYVATGHYTQNINNQLVKANDTTKDQSYFLWTLTTDHLKSILFPIGQFKKSQVRKIAAWYGLPTAIKKDSQGICFIGEIDMKEFLRHYITEQPGNVINKSGEIIGAHHGVLFYTIGERHGFTIDKKGVNDDPYYVVEKNIENNILTVSQHPNENRNKEQSQVVTLQDSVWRVPLKSLDSKKQYQAQIRYHGEYKECIFQQINDKNIVLQFNQNDYTIASGQSIVVYDNHICIGGGIVA